MTLRTAQQRRRWAQRILNSPALLADSRAGDNDARRLLARAREDMERADAAIAQHHLLFGRQAGKSRSVVAA